MDHDLKVELLPLTKDKVDDVVEAYCHYFNTYEKGTWTKDKAYRRLTSLQTMEDSLYLVMYHCRELIGVLNGYYLQYDDELALFIHELVIFEPYQNQGYGSIVLNEVKKIARKKGAGVIELMTMNDDKHCRFYAKNGYKTARHLVLMGQRIDCENS